MYNCSMRVSKLQLKYYKDDNAKPIAYQIKEVIGPLAEQCSMLTFAYKYCEKWVEYLSTDRPYMLSAEYIASLTEDGYIITMDSLYN